MKGGIKPNTGAEDEANRGMQTQEGTRSTGQSK